MTSVSERVRNLWPLCSSSSRSSTKLNISPLKVIDREPPSERIGWGPTAMAMMLRGWWARARAPSTNRPMSSGPRWARVPIIRSRTTGSAGQPSRFRNPEIPHMRLEGDHVYRRLGEQNLKLRPRRTTQPVRASAGRTMPEEIARSSPQRCHRMSSYAGCGSRYTLQHFLDYPVLLLSRETGEHWQGKDLGSDSFCHWVVPFGEFSIAIRLLQVKRNGIMNPRSDAVCRQTAPESFAVVGSYDIEVIHRSRVRSFVGHSYQATAFREQLLISLGMAPAFRVPLVHMSQFYT